ncbi:hypothetical protein PT974_08226 [Cladobotryum mycophilum]|uniref:Uncharacterized protein n=1 Tax=Cladobotryum mycophilum TaxID=491253 RepID=A0ABR0SCQ9_9HYPO
MTAPSTWVGLDHALTPPETSTFWAGERVLKIMRLLNMSAEEASWLLVSLELEIPGHGVSTLIILAGLGTGLFLKLAAIGI